jgi:hypothetical protein
MHAAPSVGPLLAFLVVIDLRVNEGRLTNSNDLAIDPLAVVGGEESNHASNVERLTNTLVRRPGGSILERELAFAIQTDIRANIYLIDFGVAQFVATGNVLLAHGMVHVGLDATGGNAVDSDLLVTSINGEAASEGLDGAL